MSSRNSRNHAENMRNYMSKQKTSLIVVNPEKDNDIVAWFDSQKNRNKAVRSLIRQSLKNKKSQIKATSRLREKRRNEGLCIYCGAKDERTESGKSVCQSCTDRVKERRMSKCAK